MGGRISQHSQENRPDEFQNRAADEVNVSCNVLTPDQYILMNERLSFVSTNSNTIVDAHCFINKQEV